MATIKAGTYKFNAVPNTSTTRLENVSYTVWTDCANPIKVTMTGNGSISFTLTTKLPTIRALSSNTSSVTYERGYGWLLTDEESSEISSQISTTGAYVEFPSDVTASNDFYTWFTANTVQQLTLRESVEQHIQDAYTAIGNKSGTIPTQKNLANLAGAIGTISTGVDTSDGNIEPTTVLKGYKGYAKGVAVNGAIETYDGTVENDVVIDVVKGDLITIENRQYRVLNVNDTVAEVLAMYDANTSQQFNATSKTVAFTSGIVGQQYKGSDLDTYLNETFFAILSETMQSAIIPKAISQDMWGYSDSVPSAGTYYHQTYGSKNRYYYNHNYGTAEVGSRNVYALSIKDVIDYLGVSAGGDFADTDIWQMFWNDNVSHKSLYPWLRSAYYNGVNYAAIVYGDNGVFNWYNHVYAYIARPAFQIDLSKIAYTKN